MSVLQEDVHEDTLADLLERLGGISPQRVRLRPPPGTATEKDLIEALDHTNRLYELVEGTLVEKTVGYREGSLAFWLGHLLQSFLDRHDLGNLAGPDATMRLMPKLVRLPDVSFVRWEKFPGRVLPSEPIPDLVPDLAVEVLSKGNTPGEMQRKLREYFLTGVEVVWFVDPRTRTVEVYTGPDRRVVLTEADTLAGGTVLPGLALPVREIFSRLPPEAPESPKAKARRSAPRRKPRAK